MEAASPTRELSGEKAQRIVDAMRTSVGLRGTTGSTFDHVAREAGVSRGLLHYYFGTKERLLVEVVRRDCDLRMERLSETVAGLDGADALLGGLVQALNETLEETPEFFVILLELHTLARRNEEIAAALAELHRRVRDHVAGLLADARDGGTIRLAAEPGRGLRGAVRARRRARDADARRARPRLRAVARDRDDRGGRARAPRGRVGRTPGDTSRSAAPPLPRGRDRAPNL